MRPKGQILKVTQPPPPPNRATEPGGQFTGGDRADANVTSARDACIRLIGGGGALLFAGAGCSVPAAFPPWTKLLLHLETICASLGGSFAPDAEERERDVLAYEDRLQDHFASMSGGVRRYEAELYTLFRGPATLTPFHRNLVALPFRGFLTTNYDDTLQAALALRQQDRNPTDKTVIVADGFPLRLRDYLNGLTAAGSGRMVAHLHGYHAQPQTIVLGSRDYQRVYGDRNGAGARTILTEFLGHILSTWSLVFVGFSFKDPFLVTFLEAAADRYLLRGQPAHYALVETTEATRAFDLERAAVIREEFGVVTVFYDNEGGTHAALYEFVRDMRHALVPPQLDQINAITREASLE